MTMQQDLADLLGVWGAPADGTGPGLYSIARSTLATSDSGSNTPTFVQVDQQEGAVFPYMRKGESTTLEVGVAALNMLLIVFPGVTNVQENDRVRPPSWQAGDDDYYVSKVNPCLPSHVEVIIVKVTGNAI